MKIFEKIDIGFILYFGAMVYATFFATRFFGTNDDMLMMLFTSGVYTGSPSEYIVFENILLGQLFKQLYIYFPTFNWYVFVLTSVQVFSFTVLYTLMKRLLPKRAFLFLFVLPMLYFIVELTLYLQFTKVSFLSAIVGILCLAIYIQEKEKKQLFYAYIFLLFALLVRVCSVHGAILLALPMGLFILLRNKEQFLNFKFLGFLFFFLFSMLGLNIYNHNYYNSTQEWKSFKELIDIRGDIYYDRSITKECFLREGEKYNISPNDVLTYYKWTNDDSTVFTPELLNHIMLKCSQGTSSQFKKVKNLTYVQIFLKKLYSFEFIFLFIFFLYLFLLMPKRYKILYMGYFTYFMIVLFYLFTMTFENRVVSSLALEFYLCSLLLLYIVQTQKYFIYRKSLSFSILTLFIVAVYVSHFSNGVLKKKPFYIESELSILKGQYVIVSKSRNFFSYLPLNTNFIEMFKNTTYYYIGWNLGSPDNNKILGNAANFYELALTEPNVIFYVDAHRLSVIKQYFLEHFEKHVLFYNLRDDYYKMKII